MEPISVGDEMLKGSAGVETKLPSPIGIVRALQSVASKNSRVATQIKFGNMFCNCHDQSDYRYMHKKHGG